MKPRLLLAAERALLLAARAAPLVARDGAGVGGAAAIAYGAAQVYPPAGWMVGGALLLAGALLAGRATAG